MCGPGNLLIQRFRVTNEADQCLLPSSTVHWEPVCGMTMKTARKHSNCGEFAVFKTQPVNFVNKTSRSLLDVQGTSITVVSKIGMDFICLTDIAKLKNPDHSDDVIRNWLRSRSTVEFLGVWERLNNPEFNPVEFDGIRIQTGLNSFVVTPKQWIEKTSAIGLHSSAGRYGGIYARA